MPRRRELYFLKLGGAAITDKTKLEAPRPDVIRRAAQEISAAREAKGFRTLLGHGSGSFGHPAAQKYGVHKGLSDNADWQGFAETQAAAARLNHLVADIFRREGLPILPLQPSASAVCRDGELVSLAVDPIREALERNLIPLVWGDVAFDVVQGSAIISTEALFAFLAPILKPNWIFLAGDVEGVFAGDPKSNPSAQPIMRLTPRDLPKLTAALVEPEGSDVSGGMGDKLNKMARLVEEQPGLRVRFLSALTPGLIQKVLFEPEAAIGTLLTNS